MFTPLPHRPSRLHLRLLAYLSAHAGEVLTRDQLLDQVWGVSYMPSSNVVDVQVAKLRRSLGAARGSVRTVAGRGYSWSVVLLACASMLLGGGMVTPAAPVDAPREVLSEAPLCVRLLPSGVVVEGPEVCPSPDVAPVVTKEMDAS